MFEFEVKVDFGMKTYIVAVRQEWTGDESYCQWYQTFTRYAKTNQSQTNADHSDNDEMALDMDANDNPLTAVWPHRDIAANECIGYVGKCIKYK